MHPFILILGLLNVIIVTCVATIHPDPDRLCHPREIQTCLQPSMAYLQNVSRIYRGEAHGGGILQTTLHFYFITLSKIQSSTYHTHSFQTVMVRLDDIFSHRTKLQVGCRLFKEAENCLYLKKQWCSDEARGVLEGIENIFDLICNVKYMKVFEENESCMIGSAMELARVKCDKDLQTAFKDIGLTFAFNNAEDESQNRQNYYQNEADVVPVCNAVRGALTCYKEASASLCGGKYAEWEYRLRHDLVQLLLSNLNCEGQEWYDYVEPLSDSCFVCDDNTECIYGNVKCNGYKDCTDGSDESSSICGQGWSGIDITLLTGAAIAVIIAMLICIIKYREDIQYTVRHRIKFRNTEMQVLNNEDDDDEVNDVGTDANDDHLHNTMSNFQPLRSYGNNKYEHLNEQINNGEMDNV